MNPYSNLEGEKILLGDQQSPDRNMIFFKNESDEKKGIVVILPGGGYQHLSDREAEPIADKYLKAGYHAAVVRYAVAPNKFPEQLLDAVRALEIIKNNAEIWNIDMNQIFVGGFSAGGHLSAMTANMYRDAWIKDEYGIDIGDLKIRGSLLCYAVLNSGEYAHQGSFFNLLGEGIWDDKDRLWQFSMENRVDYNTPPTFLWHTAEDGSVPVENTLLYAMALRKHEIPFEVHIFPHGGHGVALATEETSMGPEHILPHVAKWIDLSIDWLRLQK